MILFYDNTLIEKFVSKRGWIYAEGGYYKSFMLGSTLVKDSSFIYMGQNLLEAFRVECIDSRQDPDTFIYELMSHPQLYT